MKAFIIATALAMASTVTSAPVADAKGANRTFCPVKLPGGHWDAGKVLFLQDGINGYHAPFDKWTKEAWGEHMLGICRKDRHCTSCMGSAANNSGSTGGRYWFGYTFGGGPTTIANYTRAHSAANATAYTIVEGKNPVCDS